MKNYEFIKATQNLYAPVGFEKNPFSITPLFRSFKSLAECQKDEKLFILPEALAREINILTRADNKRVLVYGHYGVGKTSLVDFIMYIAYHYRHKFCVRLIVNEDNIQQAIGEILLNIILFHEILEARIQSVNPHCALLDLFEADALVMLHQVSNGVQKHFIRMAENALDLAVSLGAKKISQHHCLQIVESNKDSVSINLSDIQFTVMDYLGHNGSRSSSDSQFQAAVHISRAQLRNILDELFAGGYLYKEKKGRKNYYTLTSRYLPYFAGSLYARVPNGTR